MEAMQFVLRRSTVLRQRENAGYLEGPSGDFFPSEARCAIRILSHRKMTKNDASLNQDVSLGLCCESFCVS